MTLSTKSKGFKRPPRDRELEPTRHVCVMGVASGDVEVLRDMCLMYGTVSDIDRNDKVGVYFVVRCPLDCQEDSQSCCSCWNSVGNPSAYKCPSDFTRPHMSAARVAAFSQPTTSLERGGANHQAYLSISMFLHQELAT